MDLPILTKNCIISSAGIRCYATVHTSSVERTLVLDAIKKEHAVEMAKFRKPALTVFPTDFLYKNAAMKPVDGTTEVKEKTKTKDRNAYKSEIKIVSE